MRRKQMKKNSAVKYAAALIVSVVAWSFSFGAIAADPKAVGTKITDPKAAGTKVADTKAMEQKSAEVKTPYKYNPAGKPDPFKPFIELDVDAKKKIEKAKPLPLSPLQRAAVDQFRLVGISGDEKVRKAIVQDARGRIYPLFIGTYIGLNNGNVAEILADRVIVEEKFKARAKKTKINRITMKLRTEGGERP
jgi:type IV pilus assembly protein PilP